MTNSQILTELYSLLAPIQGHTLAQETVSAVLENAQNEVHELGLQDQPIELTKRLQQYLADFEFVAEANKAS